MFKNEASYLEEWLEFQRLMGVEHVFLYDNGSTDASVEVASRFIDCGFATIVPWAVPWPPFGAVSAQTVAYAHAILNFGHNWRWMAFLDIDEFLFPANQASSVLQIMQEYEDLPAVAVFWTMFGSSGDVSHSPDSLVIERYTMRAPFPTHAKPKSIVNPAEVVAVSSPHLFDLSSGPKRAFTETREVFEGSERLSRAVDAGRRFQGKLQLNHYYTRGDIEEKISKRGGHPRDEQRLRRIAAKIDRSAFKDEAILRFVTPLKERLVQHRRFYDDHARKNRGRLETC